MTKRVFVFFLTVVMLAAFTTVASAAKPVNLFITLDESTLNRESVDFTVSWNKIGAYKCVVGATVQYLNGNIPLGSVTVYEGERLTYYSGETATLSFVIPGEAEGIELCGLNLLVYSMLYNRNGKLIVYAQSDWAMIPSQPI